MHICASIYVDTSHSGMLWKTCTRADTCAGTAVKHTIPSAEEESTLCQKVTSTPSSLSARFGVGFFFFCQLHLQHFGGRWDSKPQYSPFCTLQSMTVIESLGPVIGQAFLCSAAIANSTCFAFLFSVLKKKNTKGSCLSNALQVKVKFKVCVYIMLLHLPCFF